MPTLLESCQEHFGTKDLYSVLGIPKSSTESEVKRAYHKGSLRYHPDRVEEDEKDEATKKFQTLGKIYALLSDTDKRAVYDESGEVDEEGEVQDRDWDEYWRLLFPKITLDDVKNFEEKYKGSEEELEDLKSAYTQYSGDMDRVMESVLCCTYEDEERFQEILRNLIKTEELQSFPKFSRESKAKKENRKKRMQKEAVEAEQLGKELGLDDGEDSLRKAIQKRQESRGNDDFLAHLEEKFVKGAKKGKAAPKKDKLSGDEVEDGAVAAKSSRSKKNTKPAKKEPSDDEVSEEKPAVNKRGRKPPAEKSSTDTGKESKPARGKRGGLAESKEVETEASTKPRGRRAATNKEPNYTEDNSDEEANEKIAKPKGRKAVAKAAVDLVEEETEVEKKPAAKPKRGGGPKKVAKSSDTQEVETAKGSKPSRKKVVAKPVKESSEEEEDNEAKGDGDHVTELVSSEEDVPKNGFGDEHEDAEVKATKGNRAIVQKTVKNAEKIDPPATKKSKVETKSKRAKK